VSLDPDALAESARNRGLKLLRSRVRTPGKPGFGMLGLADPTGKPVFGVEADKTLTASAEQIADYLRKGETGDWKASLKAVGARAPRKRVVPEPPPPPPPPVLRAAAEEDSEQLAALFAQLDHNVTPDQVRASMAGLAKAGEPVLVIAAGERVVGVCAIHRTIMPQHPNPLGRITHLMVAPDERGKGFGRQLVDEAERRLLALGCTHLEVTSNDRLVKAHAFYQAIGFARTSVRFAKRIASG
jgi:ribosomal protein S18 acetylase RimI-like enzyme